MIISNYMSIIFLFVVLSIVVAIIIFEILLVKRQKKKVAFALIIIVFSLATWFSIQESYLHESGGSASVLIWEGESDIGELEIVNNKGNKALGFGMLNVTTGETPQYIRLEFNDDGELIGTKEALQYKEGIMTSLKDTPWSKLQGTSLNRQELDAVLQKAETKSFEKGLFPRAMLTNNILTVILLAIYLFGVRHNRKKRKEDINTTKIQDL